MRKAREEWVQASGDKLRKIRTDSGYTRQELTDVSGISPLTIRNWENGEREPGFWTVAKVAAALDVSPADLLPPEVVEGET